MHPNQVRDSKKQLLSKCPEVFADGRKHATESQEPVASRLYEETGHLKVELDWELSNTLDVGFCLTALYRALRRGRPEIFNTDQGSQFMSQPSPCLRGD